MTSAKGSKPKVKIDYEKLPYQELFHASTKPKVYLSTGYGGGKTYALCMKALQLMDRNRGINGGILAPDLKMFKRDVLPTFEEIAERNKFDFKFNKVDSVMHFPNAKSSVYVFHSEDEGRSIRGPNLGWGLINEVTLVSESAFKAFLARIRVKEAPFRQLAMSGTPEGFNWTYDYFIATPREDTDIFFGDMRLNTYVADDYAKTLVDSYDDLLVEQFVGGKFVNTNGLAAVYKFDRHQHTRPDVEYDETLPVWVNIDFNVAPMAATLWNRTAYGLAAFDELRLDNSDTMELAQEIKKRVGVEAILFPDPAGNARSTKSQKTDIQILREAGFEDIRFHRSIRSVKDCLSATNVFFQKNRAILNSKRCKNTIQDLEQCILKPGTNELDKSDSKRTHWLDGLKNMIHYEFPITVGAGAWRETRIR